MSGSRSRRGACLLLMPLLAGCARGRNAGRADSARSGGVSTQSSGEVRVVPYDPSRGSAPRRAASRAKAPATHDTTVAPAATPAAAPTTPAPANRDSLGDPPAIVRAYYAAVRAHDFLRAYRMWEASGRTGGRSYAQFEAGFDSTESVDASVGAAGREQGAAGSRYVTVPVTIASRLRNGTPQRFTGTYTLRRVVAAGASPAQRRWHLYAADIRQVR